MYWLITGGKQALGDERQTGVYLEIHAAVLGGPIQPGCQRGARLHYVCLRASVYIFAGASNPRCFSSVALLIDFCGGTPHKTIKH